MPRKILIEMSGGGMKIVDNVPDDAKITFGSLQPGDKTLALRIYRGAASAGNQLAVFPNVLGFRDLALEVQTQSRVHNEKAGLLETTWVPDKSSENSVTPVGLNANVPVRW